MPTETTTQPAQPSAESAPLGGTGGIILLGAVVIGVLILLGIRAMTKRFDRLRSGLQ